MAAETVPTRMRSPLEIRPFPAVTDYAARHGMPVEGLELGADGDGVRPGDEITYLLELQQAGGRRQWLVRLVAGREEPKKNAKSIPDDMIYTSTGLELLYTHRPANLDVDFIGPFENVAGVSPKAATRHGRAVVSAESLQQGLERYCESSLAIAARLKAAGIENPVYYGVGRRPKPEDIETGRKAAASFGLTPDEERLAFSVYFALRSFYQAASEIPTCRDVLEQVIQKPSLWSIAGNLGLSTNFTYGWHAVQVLSPGQTPLPDPVYLLPVSLSLNGRPALHASLAVTKTQPPLRNCAGIVALVVEHPSDAGKLVFMRLLSARMAKR
jgi:hypothetical protein